MYKCTLFFNVKYLQRSKEVLKHQKRRTDEESAVD